MNWLAQRVSNSLLYRRLAITFWDAMSDTRVPYLQPCSEWQNYPLQKMIKNPCGKDKVFYHRRLLKDASRLFVPKDNDFVLLRVLVGRQGTV